MRTAETIISSFTKRVSERESIAPDEWLQAGMFLNVLTSEESYKLFELEQKFTKVILKHIENGESNASAEKKAKITQEYLDYQKQRSFVKQIEEFIRLAKKQSSLAQAEAFGK